MKRLIIVLTAVCIFAGPASQVRAADDPGLDEVRTYVGLITASLEGDARAAKKLDGFLAGNTASVAKPLPALPVPPVMTDKGLVQAPTPRPTADFPIAKPQSIEKPLPAIKVPPTKTEKGEVKAPNPRPTPDFPVAKPQQQAPIAEIKRTKGRLDGKAVVVNQENIHVNVVLSASNNIGRKVAIEVKPGEYVLGTGTLQGWDFQPKKTDKVPPGYEIVRGKKEAEG